MERKFQLNNEHTREGFFGDELREENR